MSDESLTLIAHITVKPGSQDQAEQLMREVVVPTRKEAGCLQYEFQRSTTDGTQYCAYERWRSLADLEAHFKEPHLQKFIQGMGPLGVGTIDMRKFKLLADA